MTDPGQTKDTFKSTFLVIGLLVLSIFLVYSSALTAFLIINEYSQRTITILFYPLNKKLLIATKMLLIMTFIAIAMLAGYICCCGYIISADAAFDMLEDSF